MATDPAAEPDDLPAQQRNEAPQLDALRAAGFVADFEVGPEGLVLTGSGPVSIDSLHIDRQYRFEGASDPDDESLVLALHDGQSGLRGVLITAYGPSASAAEAEVLAELSKVPGCG